MATNQLSKFGDLSGTTYSDRTGLRYTDAYWGGSTGPSVRNTGFIPNTPISPIQMNTLFSQTTMCSYILGQVLASDAIKTKAGTSTITNDITSELTQDDANTNYASKFIDFLNRINEISGNGGTGTESVWRSRQLGNSDTSSNYWYLTQDNVLRYSTTGSKINTNEITCDDATTLIIPELNRLSVRGSTNLQNAVYLGPGSGAGYVYFTTRYQTGVNNTWNSGTQYVRKRLSDVTEDINTRIYDLETSKSVVTFNDSTGGASNTSFSALGLTQEILRNAKIIGFHLTTRNFGGYASVGSTQTVLTTRQAYSGNEVDFYGQCSYYYTGLSDADFCIVNYSVTIDYEAQNVTCRRISYNFKWGNNPPLTTESDTVYIRQVFVIY